MRLKYTFLLAFLGLTFAQTGLAQSTHLFQIGQKDSVYSNILKENREIYVQLPNSYQPGSKNKYPVIYLLDGDALLDAVVTVHNYYWGGFMPEMVIVGISNAKNRVRDLTTSKPEGGQNSSFTQPSGGAEKFTDFIETELMPYIENKYPVTNYRTLIGHSYGGLFTINALLNHTELFSNYIAIDPSLHWDDQKLLKSSQESFKTGHFQGKSLFVSLGGLLHMPDSSITIDNIMEDSSPLTLFARSNIEFVQQAREANMQDFRVEWKYYPRDLHGSIPLPSIMDGLISLFDWYQMENTALINNPETPTQEIEQWVRKRAQKLQSHLGYAVAPVDEELLVGLGHMYTDMGQPDKAKMYFELGVEYYPESANAHGSLADYFAKQKDYKSALDHATKAFELSGSTNDKKKMERFKSRIK